jgi:hypothetical protein
MKSLEDKIAFAVQITRNKRNGGGTFLASGNSHNAGPASFYYRRQAVEYKNQLAKELKVECRVIRVRLTIKLK